MQDAGYKLLASCFLPLASSAISACSAVKLALSADHRAHWLAQHGLSQVAWCPQVEDNDEQVVLFSNQIKPKAAYHPS
jgi:hypothetical protein